MKRYGSSITNRRKPRCKQGFAGRCIAAKNAFVLARVLTEKGEHGQHRKGSSEEADVPYQLRRQEDAEGEAVYEGDWAEDHGDACLGQVGDRPSVR